MFTVEDPIGCSSVEVHQGTVAARRAARENYGATFHCNLAFRTAAVQVSRPSLETVDILHVEEQVSRPSLGTVNILHTEGQVSQPSPELVHTLLVEHHRRLDGRLLVRKAGPYCGLVAQRDANTAMEGPKLQKWYTA
jgi:hypothetical protein